MKKTKITVAVLLGLALSSPAALTLLDDFNSGDLSGYTTTRILDAGGAAGVHNTAAWSSSGGQLQLTTTVYDGIEQYAFIRNGLSLKIGQEVQCDLSSKSGSQDLGLYVGGLIPTTDVRRNYVSLYARTGDGRTMSAGAYDADNSTIATSFFGTQGTGNPATKLFIAYTAAGTFETGYYDASGTRIITQIRTGLTYNDASVVGFYADVRAAGTDGFVDNLQIYAEPVTTTGTTPADGSSIFEPQPEISITLIDGSNSVSTNTIAMTINGNSVAANATSPGSGTNRVAYTPASALALGDYDVQVTYQDNAAQDYTNSWSFTVAAVAMLVNGDFEACTQNCFDGFDAAAYDVPGWKDISTTTTACDSGPENASAWWGTYAGYSAFMRSAVTGNDPGMYQETEYTIQAGDAVSVAFYAKGWSYGNDGAEFTVSLFAGDIASNNVVGTFNTGALNRGGAEAWTHYEFLTHIATEFAGQKLGISFVNTSTDALTYANIDEISMERFVDVDGDGLSDPWEQQIIDANPNDAIVTIYDVHPVDDFDNDGFTNQQEYDLGLDPAVANAADTDIDGDYLPDLWELNALSNLTYNSYDDPDLDGYNNQAERVGGTNPLLDSSHPSWKSPSVAYMRDSIVAANALLMGGGSYGRAINGLAFQDQIIQTFDGYQYTAYYDTVGSVQKVCLARRTVKETAVGPWEIVQTDSEFLNGDESAWDAHNVISFGICPADGTLHVAWDHHNNTLRYRRSVVGLCTTNKAAWGGGMLNAEQNWLVAPGQTELDVTYPQFVATPTGELVLNRRIGISGNGDQLLQVYNPSSGVWNAAVQFMNRAGTYTGPDPVGTTRTATTRCAYLNGFDFGQDGTIHITWTWRESASQYGNRDICYAYSPDMGATWFNNADIKIADTGSGQKITMNSPGVTVTALDMRQLLINNQSQCVDTDDRVHALMLHRRQDPGYEPAVFSRIFSTKFTAYYHYFRDPATGEWTQRRIPPDGYPVGSRPCIGYDAQGNVYAAYLSYPAGTDVFPGYRENDDFSPLVIASASKASGYTDWEVRQVVDGDFDGEPLIDQERLINDGILAVYIQEHETYTSGAGIPTPLHVYEFAVDVPEPSSVSKVDCSYIGDDVLISAFGQIGSNYQLQVSENLAGTNGWLNVGSSVNASGSLVALPDADGLQNDTRFYRVSISPVL